MTNIIAFSYICVTKGYRLVLLLPRKNTLGAYVRKKNKLNEIKVSMT